MRFLKKKNSNPFFEDPVEKRFDTMMKLVKDLSKKDYKRLREAMDLGYSSYQKVRDIEPEDPEITEPDDTEFLTEEGK